MGKKFGNLQRLSGVTYYVLSPNEIKPFAGILVPGFKNTIRRIGESIFPVGIPFLVSFLVYDYTKNVYHQSMRKNPADYENDE